MLKLGREMQGPLTILVVDDELVVRELVAHALRREGYAVLLAENGYEAIALARGQAEQIRLVVTDIGLPGIDGLEAADRIRMICPGAQFIFMSGHLDPARLAGCSIGADAGYLRKPFRSPELVAAVRAACVKGAAP